MPRIAKATTASGTDHKLTFTFEGHPETRLKGREYKVPPECPKHEIFVLQTRLATCAASNRGGRIYEHVRRNSGLFITMWIGDYARADLLMLQKFANDNFTAKGAPTARYMRRLVDVEGFEWDNAKWAAKWDAMTAEERGTYLLR